MLYLIIMKADERTPSWQERHDEARHAAARLEWKIMLKNGALKAKLAVGKAGGKGFVASYLPSLHAVGKKPQPPKGPPPKPRGSVVGGLPIGQGVKRKQEGGLVFRINLFRECGLVFRINLFRKCVV